MDFVDGLVVFMIIWWMVFFMVLPVGVRTHDDVGAHIEPGSVSSAPVKPRIGRKLLITTPIAGAVWLVYWWAITYGGLTLGGIPG